MLPEIAVLLRNETHRMGDFYAQAWQTFMAATTTIVKESNLVLWSVVGKDLEPRSDGRPCPNEFLRLGFQLSSVRYQGVAMLCTTRVIHCMSSE